VLVENNFFYKSGNPWTIQAGDYTGLAIRYNSIVGPMMIHTGYGDGQPVELVANITGFASGMCSGYKGGSGAASPLVWRYNVLGGGTCGTTDVNAPNGFVDPTSNLRLAGGAAAINRGDPTKYPARDIDRTARPLGGAPDAGADEAG